MKSIGINIGSSSVKVVLVDNGDIIWKKVLAHEGSFLETVKTILTESDLPRDLPAMVTGTEGRFLLKANNVLESLCIEEALNAKGLAVDAVVSLGGENFVVYTIDKDGKIITNFSGNKCAAGTGEFFKQQLGRMDMRLTDIQSIPQQSSVKPLSTRCSVFMKSDCTHKLNKGEATKGDIVLSLSDVMATKVIDFLKRAKISQGRVLLSGGLTLNPYIITYLKEKLPKVDFIVPEEAHYFEAYGAAVLAQKTGSIMPPISDFFKENEIGFGRLPSLKTAEGKVEYLQSKRGKARPGGEYILGIDGGSTTTKVALIDIETEEIVAAHYGRTHGDPVKALKNCIVEVKKQLKEQIGDEKINLSITATTGSSREILGVFLETGAIYNEIIAHAVGTTYFKEDIDTIFEIGGQDAKYVFIKNKVPIDYAMNEACSAGTGSFLEESASGDLNINDVTEIGDIAMKADAPLKFGETCSAFINSDIRLAIQHGAVKEDITAGIICSIVSNYLNRVVGNRSIGQNIVLQGGVAKNKAVPMAFAMLMNKNIIIPPDPELLGCFGVGILAKQKLEAGLIEKGSFDFDQILESDIVYEKEFICRSCDNYCPIRVLNVNGHKYMFGGRCNKYANSRKKKNFEEGAIFNYLDKREELMFEEIAPDPASFEAKRDIIVGIPRAFSIYTLWPFYSWFFHTLGIKAELTDTIEHEGIARAESAYCFPAEIAHGTVQSAVNAGYDYIFVPHFRDMPSYEQEVHANFCPITQALPYYITKAFSDVPKEKFLTPVVSFKYGLEKALEGLMEMSSQLGVGESDIRKAFNKGHEMLMEFHRRYKEMGKEALEDARKADRPVIALLGRPYNAFTKDANMGIPKKFTSRGFSILPFDMLPYEGEDIFDNMYWYYGQQDMRASAYIKKEPNLYITWISNFSCAPDSFMLHYVKWMMGTKPFLILELDSHSADAGIDTRVEAFLDIIEGYREKIEDDDKERYDNGLRFINNGKDPLHIMDIKNDERIDIFGNKNVTMLLSNMGRIGTELLASTLRGIEINAEAMPVPDTYTLQIARNYMSGKECLPSQLVLGAALKFFFSDKYNKDETYLLFVPTTTGPCRTGQYYIFYENLFKDLELHNVVIVTLDSDNSYNELGPTFSQSAWWALMIGDMMKDVETALRTLALDPAAAIAKYDELSQNVLDAAEKGVEKLLPELRSVAKEIAKIPVKQAVEETPKVLIVGEIYVRRDDFAVDEMVRILSKKGIIGKVSDVTEWVYYTDHTRKLEIMKRLKLQRPWQKGFWKEVKEYLLWRVEEIWKHGVEHKVAKALKPSKLLVTKPHNMDEIMGNAYDNFVTPHLESEISISSGVASTAMLQDFSGVINISPFACLIGRVIEGIVNPWARDRKLPFMSIEIDGEILPPSVLNKLEIFMLNVLRFRQRPDATDLVEKADEVDVSLDRKIIKE